jgi:hypothetical protein
VHDRLEPSRGRKQLFYGENGLHNIDGNVDWSKVQLQEKVQVR